MTEQHQEFLNAGAEVIALVNDTEEHALAYFKGHGIPFPCLIDPGRIVYGQYEVQSRLLSLGQRPGLYVIDREGVVRYAYLGWQQWEIPGNAEVLEACRDIRCQAPA